MKRILIVLSECGYWGEELVGPLETFDEAGYEVDFATPHGQAARRRCRRAWTPHYIDPPLGRSVTSQEMAEKVRALDASDALDKPIDISSLDARAPVLERRRPSSASMEAYYARARRRSTKDLATSTTRCCIVGGSGPIVDLVNNQRVHDLILGFYKLGKPIGAECYGVACLAFARDLRRPQEHHLGQARHRATASSTTTRTAPASWAPTSTWARRRTRSSTSCATRPARTAPTTATSATRRR